jgi:hypothetical protein
MRGGMSRIASSADEPHVGLLLFLADVHVHVAGARVFADDHALVDRLAGSMKISPRSCRFAIA